MLGYEQTYDTEVDLSGFYIALVVDNLDPKAIERVRVRVLGVHDMSNEKKENSMWANHVAPSKSNSGEIPDIGDHVYVSFLQNNPMNLLWWGWVRGIKG